MRLRLALACALVALPAVAATLHPEDYDRVRGTWQLQDGSALALVGSARHPRLELPGGRSAALQARSALDYETADGCLRLQFSAHANGVVTQLQVLRLPACRPS